MAEKNREILNGIITKMDSGEKWRVEFKPYFTDVTLMAIVKVENIEIDSGQSNEESVQINVQCSALDSVGFIYCLNLIFMPETVAERDKIVAAMKTEAIFIVCGKYSIHQGEGIIYINDPEYLPLPQSLDEEEIREVFRVNIDVLKLLQ